MIQQITLIVHILLAFSIIGLVLLQQGKGADAGAAFGTGASSTVFGSQGSGNFLTRATTTLALFFAITSISLTLLANKTARPETLTDKLMKQEAVTVVPATPTEIPNLPEN